MKPKVLVTATVTEEFQGRPDGDALARTINVGETITGDLATTAIAGGQAKEGGNSAPTPRRATAKKAPRAKKPSKARK